MVLLWEGAFAPSFFCTAVASPASGGRRVEAKDGRCFMSRRTGGPTRTRVCAKPSLPHGGTALHARRRTAHRSCPPRTCRRNAPCVATAAAAAHAAPVSLGQQVGSGGRRVDGPPRRPAAEVRRRLASRKPIPAGAEVDLSVTSQPGGQPGGQSPPQGGPRMCFCPPTHHVRRGAGW